MCSHLYRLVIWFSKVTQRLDFLGLSFHITAITFALCSIFLYLYLHGWCWITTAVYFMDYKDREGENGKGTFSKWYNLESVPVNFHCPAAYSCKRSRKLHLLFCSSLPIYNPTTKRRKSEIATKGQLIKTLWIISWGGNTIWTLRAAKTLEFSST